jgi:hypothetical protein
MQLFELRTLRNTGSHVRHTVYDDRRHKGGTSLEMVMPFDAAVNVERRRDLKLRAIFPDARTRIANFFHGRADWINGSNDYLAQRIVHEAYPDLTSAEVRTLVAIIERRAADGIRNYMRLDESQ